MSQKLPTHGFKWLSNLTNHECMKDYNPNKPTSYIQ